jgi:hypothetical protein
MDRHVEDPVVVVTTPGERAQWLGDRYARIRFQEIEADLIALDYLAQRTEDPDPLSRARGILSKLQYASQALSTDADKGSIQLVEQAGGEDLGADRRCPG